MNEAMVEAKDVTLLDLVDRVVDHGVILAGDITISVADIDLIYLGLRVLLASVERAEELGAGREMAARRERKETGSSTSAYGERKETGSSTSAYGGVNHG